MVCSAEDSSLDVRSGGSLYSYVQFHYVVDSAESRVQILVEICSSQFAPAFPPSRPPY